MSLFHLCQIKGPPAEILHNDRLFSGSTIVPAQKAVGHLALDNWPRTRPSVSLTGRHKASLGNIDILQLTGLADVSLAIVATVSSDVLLWGCLS